MICFVITYHTAVCQNLSYCPESQSVTLYSVITQKATLQMLVAIFISGTTNYKFLPSTLFIAQCIEINFPRMSFHRVFRPARKKNSLNIKMGTVVISLLLACF
jgi:hypothetical protein